MRVEIKTKGKIKDNDLRALYLLNEAMRISSSDKMRRANVRFIVGKWKLQNIEK